MQVEGNSYTTLMQKRVRRILLVCNNYDSFALEEDGRIDVQIAQEYAELKPRSGELHLPEH